MQSETERKPRLMAIDALRGAVMILMALDHTRDFFHSAAASFSPEDLSKTTPVLFFTRWLTHFCLPVFMFLAGMGIFLWQCNQAKGQLARFLLTRGLWLLVLELIIMRLAYNFSLSLQFPIFLLVLWAFGSCMIAMAALIYLPTRLLAIGSIAVIALHNLLDGIPAAQFGAGSWVWNLPHQVGAIRFAGSLVVVSYPLIPWVTVMASGFCFGRVFLLEPSRRRQILLKTGCGLTAAFILMRAINVYGDPSPWSVQPSGVFTLLSFLRCTKYPASLDFLLMTLGPALVVLAYLDRCRFNPANPLIVFGRVPLFFFIAHFYVIHVIFVAMAWFRYGNSAFTWMFNPPPSMGGPPQLFPADFGYSLGVVYVVWALVVVALYALCRWFGKVKSSRRDWWLSYL